MTKGGSKQQSNQYHGTYSCTNTLWTITSTQQLLITELTHFNTMQLCFFINLSLSMT